MTIILGIDPGSRITGYGIINQDNYVLTYLGSGSIHTNVDIFADRLKIIYNEISNVMTKFQPDTCAMEQVFVAKNINSALKLGQSTGVIIVAATHLSLSVFEYSASQIKRIVAGHGAAKKHQVQYMVRTLLKLSFDPQYDAADALAVAITHGHMIKG